jgi:Fungalysin/Thermolysin Propeptide Motif
VRIVDNYRSDNGIEHVYLVQTFNDLDIVNAVSNVNLDHEGRLLSIGQSFYKPNTPSSIFSLYRSSPMIATKPTKTHLEALENLFVYLGLDYSKPTMVVAQGENHFTMEHPL